LNREGAKEPVSQTAILARKRIMALVRLIHWELLSGKYANWRSLLGESSIFQGVADSSAAIEVAMKQDIVQHVRHQVP
jgi:hypothetical protein